MRHALALVALAALPLSSGCAFRHLFLAVGPSRVPYQGRALHPASGGQVGLTLPQLPGWGIAYGGNVSTLNDSAAFVQPNCSPLLQSGTQQQTTTSCHPSIVEQEQSVALQYRWRSMHSVHPLASATFGELESSYRYGFWHSYHRDSVKRFTFVSVAGGAEISLTRWLHGSVSAGYRAASAKSVPAGTTSNSGFTLASMLLVGVPSGQH